jgi:hypothetical protein
VLVPKVTLRGESKLVQEIGRKGSGVGDIREVVMVFREIGKAADGGEVERIQLLAPLTSKRGGELVFLGQGEIQLGSQLIVIVLVV